MFDAQRLLGGLVKSQLRGSRRKSRRRRRRRSGLGSMLGSGATTAIGMGALGVGIAAFEHFTSGKSSQKQGGAAPPPAPGSAPAAPPPSAPSGAPSASGPAASPPPPPPAAAGGPPGAPPTPASPEGAQEEALLLIRAMIAAAAADGQIDDEERGAILLKMRQNGFGKEERDFLRQQMEEPLTLQDLLQEVSKLPNPVELKPQVYAASLLAIEVDTDEERDYLKELARRLGLEDAERRDIESSLGVEIE